MGFGFSKAAFLALLGQNLLLASIPKLAHGLALKPEYYFDDDAMIPIRKRAGTDSSEDWIDIPDMTGWRLHPNCKGYMETESGSDSDSGSDSSSGSESDIADSTFEWFKTTLGNVQHINKAAQGAIPTLNDILDKYADKEELDDDERAQIEFFGKMYGTVDSANAASIQRGKDRVEKLGDFVDKFVAGMDDNTFKGDIICDYELWKTVEVNGQSVFTLENESNCPTFRIRGSQADPCSSSSGSNEKTVMGFSARTVDNTRNYLTVCPSAWTHFDTGNSNNAKSGDSLIEWSSEGLGDLIGPGMQGKSLESVVRFSPEGFFTHEMSHFNSEFGDDGRMIDVKLKAGMGSAYGWDNVVALGQQDIKEGDVSKVDALKNAETYEFWAGGAYLSVCDWSSGTCFEPGDDSDCEIDMS